MRLSRLEIEDFGLIARAALDFSDGFTACTGETGSGKTMLLGALAFALGERAGAGIVRRGAARARVTLALESGAGLTARLADEGFETEPGEPVIFVREMLENGKSVARVNGRLATAAQLRAFGALALDRIGQHEQQRLLSRAYQTDVLDGTAGDAALALRARIAVAYARTRALEAELRERDDDARRGVAELEFARFAADEIDRAEVAAGEDAVLRERRDYLANAERIQAALSAAYDALGGSENGALDALGAATTTLSGVARFAPALEALATTLAGLQSEVSDAAARIARELDAAEFDPRELDAASARLDRLERLKKKYGGSLEAVLDARARFKATIARETTRDERGAELRAELARAAGALAADARALGKVRRKAARVLAQRVESELAALAMPAARFTVVLEPLAACGRDGAESVEFALSPNPGEPVRPLASAASGGELARVLLALVVVSAHGREGTALAFDEIDAGIGGVTAAAVGIRLGALAQAAQVLCVTHLAQIASWADRHYALRKREHDGTTLVELVALDDRTAVLEELARMLSGNTAAVALEHAETLVRDVRARKMRTSLTA